MAGVQSDPLTVGADQSSGSAGCLFTSATWQRCVFSRKRCIFCHEVFFQNVLTSIFGGVQ